MDLQRMILCPCIDRSGTYTFCLVCLSVGLSVCLQKTFKLAVGSVRAFEWDVFGLSYFTCVFFVVRPFLWCQGQSHLPREHFFFVKENGC